MPSTYTLISSNVLASSAASVTFSSIPSTYTDLVLRCSTRGDRVQVTSLMYVYFNGNAATALYSAVKLMGDGSTASSSLTTGEDGIQVLGTDYSSATADTFGNQELYIPNYAGSTTKQTSNFGVAETNAASSGSAPGFGVAASLFNSTSAITSLTAIPITGNWVSGSSFYLYGIKNS